MQHWLLRITGTKLLRSTSEIALWRIKLDNQEPRRAGWYKVVGYEFSATANPRSGKYFVNVLQEVKSDLERKVREETEQIVAEVSELIASGSFHEARIAAQGHTYRLLGHLKESVDPPTIGEEDAVNAVVKQLRALIFEEGKAVQPPSHRARPTAASVV